MNRQINGRMGGWMDGLKDRWTDVPIYREKDRGTDEQTHKWKDGWMDGGTK